jgi:hypothetical protein
MGGGERSSTADPFFLFQRGLYKNLIRDPKLKVTEGERIAGETEEGILNV